MGTGSTEQQNKMSVPFSKEDLAHRLYDDYCKAVGGKAFNGDSLPPSSEFFADETKQKQADAWRVVADTATKILTM